ncbi:aldo/keto reductase [Sulfurimonas marina]|uniref:Aldo/keto reductase n=1 Tax=Sulfurimonas marina TaxID=2590551 RepID=A0A7M3V9K1_9BACT|nr:aldo/keto reductase [Sulfurimonas marina]QOP40434.1 aldo/keto reductase [Sulfurimonas marina]
MSSFAFGTYRVTDLNPLHIEALKEALYSGIKLIDTSSNYTDGGAERAIAKALNSIEQEYRDVEIVSKFGYIQGTNMMLHKENPFEEVVEYSPECYHSISPSFMQDQLKRSLERLQLNKIDCYLLHNPEYFLYDGLKKGLQKEEILDQMYQRIYKVFVALEKEVQNGTIGSYGISSNSFSKPENADDFLPYTDLLTLAKNAAIEAGSEQHSFTTLQLPINLLEQEGLKCATWAKENGLRVLVNRPLNAFKDSLMFRLADYDEPLDYYHNLNELLEVCDTEALKPLFNLIEQMDENKHKYGWIGDYDMFVNSQIIPHIKKTIEKLDKEVIETLLAYIDRFLVSYRDMVAYECSKATRIQLKNLLEDCDKKLQECAFEFLQNQDSIDYILVGMRKPSYVAEVLALKE